MTEHLEAIEAALKLAECCVGFHRTNAVEIMQAAWVGVASLRREIEQQGKENDLAHKRAILYVSLSEVLLARYVELFPNYAWTDEHAAVDLMAADLLTTRKEREQQGKEIERLTRIVHELGEQMEFDRTAVAASMTAANRAVDGRHWLTEGRGSYEWDDDRWHGEFREAAGEIKKALEPLTKIAANWSGCPIKSEEVAQARIDLKQRAEAAEKELTGLRKKAGEVAEFDWGTSCSETYHFRRISAMEELRAALE